MDGVSKPIEKPQFSGDLREFDGFPLSSRFISV
jgi:hypothetical protein